VNMPGTIQDKRDFLAEKLSALNSRERVLVMITSLAGIAAFWYSTFMAPLAIRADQSRTNLTEMTARITTTNATLQGEILQLAGNSSQGQARISILRKQIDEINVTLGDYLAELIDPAEMAEVLEGVLREQSDISLVRMRNLAPELLSASDEENATILYRHGLEIEVEGSFAACLDYLEAIEALPWHLYWRVLELDIIEYPRNHVRIEVSTLSLNEEWIGA